MAEILKNAGTRSSKLSEMPWNEIHQPGCYLFIETGDLARVPAEGLAAGHSPLVSFTSNKDVRVARLSENPATPVTTLRSIAGDNDYYSAF